jgi:hypothetical protein
VYECQQDGAIACVSAFGETYLDDDGDGFGDDWTLEATCPGDGRVTVGGDCDDAKPAVNPGAHEICGNGIDEDCLDGDPPCACDVVAQDCPSSGLKCAYDGNLDFACQSNGSLEPGDECFSVPSDCPRGTLCSGFEGTPGFFCTPICDPTLGPESCGADALCVASIPNHPEAALCFGYTFCDPVDDPTACGAGEQCWPYSNTGAVCIAGGGTLAEDALCNANDDKCGPGLLCLDFGSNDYCRAWCKPARGDADCEGSARPTCGGFEYTSTLAGTSEVVNAFGYCD